MNRNSAPENNEQNNEQTQEIECLPTLNPTIQTAHR